MGPVEPVCALTRSISDGSRATACGIVTMRQQPETAKGVIFALICFAAYAFSDAAVKLVEGRVPAFEAGLIGSPMQDLIGNPKLLSELVEGGYHLPVCEIVINREPYMLETMPLHEAGGRHAVFQGKAGAGGRLGAVSHHTHLTVLRAHQIGTVHN